MIRKASPFLAIRILASRKLLGVVFLFLILAKSGHSQSSTDGLTPPSLTPGSPAGSYSLTDFENVNLFNGNLNFHLPLVKVGGRGSAQTALVLKIETRWRIEEHAPCSPCASFFYPTYNWWTAGPTPGYGPGSLAARVEIDGDSSCSSNPGNSYYSLFRLTFTAADGTEYELRDKLTNGQPFLGIACGAPGFRGREFVTSDGTSAIFISDADISDNGFGFSSGDLMLRDGTRYRIINGGQITSMRDRNANRITYAYDINGRVTTVNDSLGRTITVQYDQQQSPYGLHDKITYLGFGGPTANRESSFS